MLFNSLAFAVFLPVVFLLYWLVPQKFKWIVLLVSSLYYYMSWEPKYIIWIFITTVVSYFGARFIEKNEEEKKKKLFLSLSVIINLGLLVYFKYFVFISSSIVSMLKMFALPVDELTLKIIMPVGISFYTFQSVGYLVDVKKGKVQAEKNFGIFALFISFFPQVLSGPIARADSLIPQIKSEKKFDFDKASYGVRQMAWGFFKKMVVSAVCAQFVNPVFDNLKGQKGIVLVISVILYAFQIYCDFSGYSDIAIGSAGLFGIDLMTNFKTPYFAQSIKEFWSRWHISLSTWFRDYVYIPLGGNRVSKFRHALNLIITFLVSGIWHGAAWTFIIWGLLHGILQVIENYVYKIKFFAPKSKEKKIFSFRGIVTLLLTFTVVCFTWIFFRANTIGDAFYIIKNMFAGILSPASYIKPGIKFLAGDIESFVRLGVSMLILIIGDSFMLKNDVFEKLGKIKPVVKWLIYIVVLLAIFVLTPSNANNDFIYFNF